MRKSSSARSQRQASCAVCEAAEGRVADLASGALNQTDASEVGSFSMKQVPHNANATHRLHAHNATQCASSTHTALAALRQLWQPASL